MNGRFELRQKQFPILSQACRLAAWTARAPYFEGTVLRHPEAEKLVGTPIVILPALLMVEAHIRIAGGDPDPEGLWVLAIAHVSCVRKLPIVIRHE